MADVKCTFRSMQDERPLEEVHFEYYVEKLIALKSKDYVSAKQREEIGNDIRQVLVNEAGNRQLESIAMNDGKSEGLKERLIKIGDTMLADWLKR